MTIEATPTRLRVRVQELEQQVKELQEALSDLLVHIPNGTATDPYKVKAYRVLAGSVEEHKGSCRVFYAEGTLIAQWERDGYPLWVVQEHNKRPNTSLETIAREYIELLAEEAKQ